jgi:hypothetical protein
VAEEYEVLLTNYPNLAVAAIDRPIAGRPLQLGEVVEVAT